MRTLLTALFCLVSNTLLLAAGPDPIQMMLAKKKYNEGDFTSALRIYKELYMQHGSDADLNIRLAECHLALKQPDEALPYLDRAMETDSISDKELRFYYALVFRAKQKHQKAIDWLNRYLAQPKLPTPDVEKGHELLAKCKTTIELMERPVNVKIGPASNNINTTDYHEYHPSITADGRIMVFTSRRPANEKGAKLDGGDGDHMEDVYITYYSDSLADWAPAIRAEGGINGPGHDAALSISPDGRQIFLYRNERGGDLFVSKVRLGQDAKDASAENLPSAARLHATSKWSSPLVMPTPINSTYWDSYASLTADGKTIYFASEREGNKAQGNGDLWVSRKEGDKWGKPINLKGINTIEDEKSVFIHPDGKTLFFSSQGHKTMGGYDIFKSVRQTDGTWSEPENLGYPINTPGDELDFTLSTDGRTGYFCKIAEGSGKYDIFTIDLSNYNLLGEGALSAQGEGMSLLKGTVNDTEGNSVPAQIRILKEGTEVNSLRADEDGEYFLALPGGSAYDVILSSPNFKELREKVEISTTTGTTRVTVRNFKMERK